MADLVHEALAVAAKKGIHLIYDDPLAQVYDVAFKTGANTSSMLQDSRKSPYRDRFYQWCHCQ